MNYKSICNLVLPGIKNLLHSDDFLNSHRVEKHFVRNRMLSMYQIIIYLIYSSKASLAINMANICDELPILSFPKVSKQALSKARRGILPSLFQELVQFSVRTYYKELPVRKSWHGYHIYAVDGTRIQLPNSKSNFEEFGEMFCINNPSRRWSTALGSVIYDVLSKKMLHRNIFNRVRNQPIVYNS